MRRVVVVAAVLAAAVAAALVFALTRGDSGSGAAASVAGHTITRSQLELTVEHFQEEAEAEGRTFPKKGTAGYRTAEKEALALLVDRAELELGAADLGIHVSDAQVERRLVAGSRGEQEGTTIRVKAEAAFARATARTQLLTEAVFARVTANATVSAAEVRAYYRAHRRLYGAARLSSVAAAIRSELLAAKKNAAMTRWRTALRRRLAPKVHYEKLG